MRRARLRRTARDVPSRRVRQCEPAVDVAQVAGHAPAIHLPEQDRGGCFDHRNRRLCKMSESRTKATSRRNRSVWERLA